MRTEYIVCVYNIVLACAFYVWMCILVYVQCTHIFIYSICKEACVVFERMNVDI